MKVFHPSIIVTLDEKIGVLRDAYLGIENGKIVYIGKEKPGEYEELIELPGRVILPGFINAHTHVPMVILRGLKDDVDLTTWLTKYIFPAEDLLEAEDIYYGALHGIAEMIESGVTLFNDMYFYEEEIAKAVDETGVRAVLSRGILDLVSEDRNAESEIQKSLNFYEYLMQMWRKKPELRERIFFAWGPHAPYTCSEELLIGVKEKADEMNSLVHIHVSETKWEFLKFQEEKKMTPIQYLDKIGFLDRNILAVHAVWLTDKDIEILADRKVSIVHNPSSNLKLGSGIAPISKLLKSNVNLAIGTDGAASNNRLDILGEIRLAALLHKGINNDPTILPAKKVLEMITINAARALGLDDKLGSISMGKKADLVIINLKKVLQSIPSHDIFAMLVYALDLRAIETVMVDGKLLYRNGEFHAIRDLDKILERIKDIRRRIEDELCIVK